MVLRGLDASSCQGKLPYEQLGNSHRFVILKSQQGNDGFDPNFVENAKAGIDAGLEVFPYCFAYPLRDTKGGPVNRSPKEQAKFFVDRTLSRCPEMAGRPFFLDYEWPEPSEWEKWGCSPQQLSDWMEANAAEVHTLTGVSPVIYTYDWWWAAVRDGIPAYGFPKGAADVSWAAQYALWMAWYVKDWPKDGDKPRIPKPWTDWLFWQFDGNGGLKLPNGIDSDFCVFNGDEGALQALSRPKVAKSDPFDIVHPLRYE